MEKASDTLVAANAALTKSILEKDATIIRLTKDNATLLDIVKSSLSSCIPNRDNHRGQGNKNDKLIFDPMTYC